MGESEYIMLKSNLSVENAKAIIADAKSDAKSVTLAKFVIGMADADADAVAVADAIAKSNLSVAVSTLWNGDKFRWDAMVDGCKYFAIDTNAETDADAVVEKVVFVRDVFCMRKTKASTKSVLDSMMIGMVAQFGINLGMAFADSHADAVSMLKVYCKFTDAPKVFFGENPNSKTSLNKQLQVIADTMLGKDAVKMLKCHVTHIMDTFIRANADGWRNGNEIALLQVIVNHIADSKGGKVYKHDSKLMAHKAPKESTK